MNLNQFLNSLDAHKPAAQPLPPHQAQQDECDEHTRLTYALMLASVLHTRPPITEAQARVFDLLLGSLGLASIQAKLFAEAQTLEESALLEARRVFTEHRLTQVFLLDVLVLERLRGPLDEESLKLLSELADFLLLNETQMHALSSMASHILGLPKIPCDWDSAISDVSAPHYLEFTFVIPTMIDIPAGKFMMGGNDKNNQPKHEVNVPPFQMGQTTVTLGMFMKFIAVTGRSDLLTEEFNKANAYGVNVPVTWVNWHDAQDFIAWLNRIDGGGYRLPSEAEWEYAGSSGGAVDDYRGGDKIQTEWSNAVATWASQPVGSKQANTFGLYDMNGNIREWVQDHRHDNYNHAPLDGSAWKFDSSKETTRVVRGGSQAMALSDASQMYWRTGGTSSDARYYFNNHIPHLRARYYSPSIDRNNRTGFRLARSR